MWGIIAGVGGFLFNFLGGKSKVLERILNIVDRQVTDETEREKLRTQLATKFLEAEVEHSQIRKDAFGPWAWVMAAIFLPGPALWFNMVFLDSIFHWKYDVLALPPEFYPWMTAIIGAIFFIPTANKIFTKK